MYKNNLEADKYKDKVKDWNVGDKIYFEEYQSQYINREFYEEYVKCMEQLHICVGYFKSFKPRQSPDKEIGREEKNILIHWMVDEIKGLPCPPSEIILKEDMSIHCRWWLPIPYDDRWSKEEEEISRLTDNFEKQFNELKYCKGTEKGFTVWHWEEGDMDIEDYLKYVYRVNQFIDVLDLKISVGK